LGDVFNLLPESGSELTFCIGLRRSTHDGPLGSPFGAFGQLDREPGKWHAIAEARLRDLVLEDSVKNLLLLIFVELKFFKDHV
jgi:hypothetical protein